MAVWTNAGAERSQNAQKFIAFSGVGWNPESGTNQSYDSRASASSRKIKALRELTRNRPKFHSRILFISAAALKIPGIPVFSLFKG
ncbi:hypothetical protein [Acidicapsa acidisoli]|uniref:hypothetical protein n=1 Tax=Acidicapsa acidisoli TaxID=1615681 RepID=UPI0021DFE1E8|nr:hypothetical protein [Acidicapsa acidisoli]